MFIFYIKVRLCSGKRILCRRRKRVRLCRELDGAEGLDSTAGLDDEEG